MKKFLFFIVLSLFLLPEIHAQDTAKAVLPSSDAAHPRDEAIYTGNVLPVDPVRTRPVYRGLIHSGRGFRVQIYSGNDRTKAITIKSHVMRTFPSIRTYLSYSAPQFKVKVGDYKSRKEANEMARILRPFFKPVMIVPDVIVVNSLK